MDRPADGTASHVGPTQWTRAKDAGPFVGFPHVHDVALYDLFVPVHPLTERLLMGLACYALYPEAWEGTPEEIAAAQDATEWQLGVPALTRGEICGGPQGAQFEDVVQYELWERQGAGLPPPPWEFRMVEEGGVYYLEYRTIP